MYYVQIKIKSSDKSCIPAIQLNHLFESQGLITSLLTNPSQHNWAYPGSLPAGTINFQVSSAQSFACGRTAETGHWYKITGMLSVLLSYNCNIEITNITRTT